MISPPNDAAASCAALGDRSLFSALESFAYLNHAAVSPLHDLAINALHEVAHSYAADPDIPAWIARREGLRQKLATLVDAESAQDIGFVQNTSVGNTHLAMGLDWRKGQTIVLMRGDFPANVIPWLEAAKLFELEVFWLPQIEITNRGAWLDLLEQTLSTRDVALVALSAVMFQTGWRLPIGYAGELCKRFGALFVVDGIQAIGVTPLSVRGCHIDALSCGGHKWLMGVEGAGFIYISPKLRARLSPRHAGWIYSAQSTDFLFMGRGHLRYDLEPRQDAAIVEGGTQPAIGYAILDASVDVLLSLTPQAIFSHVTAYLDQLETGLESLGLLSVRSSQLEARSGILAVELPPDLELGALWRTLQQQHKIPCATPDGYLRFSPYWPNSLNEIPEVLRRVDLAIKSLRG